MPAFPAPAELTATQMTGLLRLGDVVVPGDEDLPSFSASGCAAYIGEVLPYMHEADRSSFLALLTSCAKAPKPFLRAVVGAAGLGGRTPGPLGGALRMANIGIKGVIFSLYYADVSGAGIREKLDWQAGIADDEGTS